MRIMLVAACVIACSHPRSAPMPEPHAPSPLAAEAVAGITDPRLRAVVADHWELMMRSAPTFATSLGDHRYDDQLGRHDEATLAAFDRARDALLTRLAALDPASLDATDRVTCAMLRGELEADRALDACKLHEWNVDAGMGGGPLGQLSHVVEHHVVKDARDAANVVARVGQGAQMIDDLIANLSRGLAHHRVAAGEKVRRVIDQLDRELVKPVASWSINTPTWAVADGPDAWPAERARLLGELRAHVANDIQPALVRLRAFLHDRVLPQARGDQEGLVGIPDAAACYRASILKYVGLPRTPEELHALGLAEIARTDQEIAALGKKVLGTRDLAQTIDRLRTDRKLYFDTREELLAAARAALAKAKAAIPRFFSVLPKTDCVVAEIPAYAAPNSTIAYYSQPHYDGSKPGEYFVNTYQPETRPRYELEALTWHESIPGHHLQIAIAQELGALPMFRKLDGSTAFVEGWALYTERLAEEMGLYSGDLDRLGKLSYDAWRGSRLVVDTGIHAMGWTRSQAEAFMREHTALTEVNISNEVDRYIGWPGQALAYKVGQLEILKLRREAEQALGAKFDVKAFHAVVLGAGAVTLPVLADRVHAWIAQ
jgi:uncharacterized protein (DUF885 family)